jgi:sialate O-acetylesterase
MGMKTTLLLLVCLIPATRSPLKVHGLFTDGMVLQREQAVPVWGTAEPGRSVAVTVAGQKKVSTADASGKWKVVLDPLKAGGPMDLTIAADRTVTLRNVLVGEVWLCSGQSNMGWSVRLSANAAEEIAAARHPQIRLFTVVRRESESPEADVEGSWQECSPATVPTFSAVAYYFGRSLQKALNVPIGLVHSSVGATRAQAWTPRPVLEEGFKEVFAQHDKEKANPNPAVKPVAPSTLWNGMIAPLAPFAIRGAIWYQGEGNVGSPKTHEKLFPALIRSWRKEWSGEFPFLYVQLANHLARKDAPVESYWAMLRESQRLALSVPRTAMAVTIDIGDAQDIHPKNKQDVGRRLALAAEAVVYGRDVVYSGPMIASMKREGEKIRLTFNHVGGGLVAKGDVLKGFAVAGDDRKYVWAQAKVEGNTVVVRADGIAKPAAVQYGWADNPECTLYNKEGLPASPFQIDR